MSEPLTDERLAEIRREWVTDPGRELSTHSDGCWSYHPGCAIDALHAEVHRLRDQVDHLRMSLAETDDVMADSRTIDAACTDALVRLADRVLVERADLPSGWAAHVTAETAVVLRHDSYPTGLLSSVLAFPRWDGDAPFGWEFWGTPAPPPGRVRDPDDPQVSAETLADVCLYLDAKRAKGTQP